ncbi:uncharacterized protein LOC126743220 [Anthonomus grandis grandis]|uniref:uncharacterized protein LOC126743220 n=1 Tax=Anthonomus grandis grandis TaxID=2921223 RepID=UPI0021659171|nr:uncharacterized protein LOC126743220 [Anthonomus grandis grandis]
MAEADSESTGSEKLINSIRKVNQIVVKCSEEKLFSGPIIKDSTPSSNTGEWLKEEKLLCALKTSLDKFEFDKKYLMLRSPDFHQSLGISVVQKLEEEKALLENKIEKIQEEQTSLENNILTKLDSCVAYFDNSESEISDVLI